MPLAARQRRRELPPRRAKRVEGQMRGRWQGDRHVGRQHGRAAGRQMGRQSPFKRGAGASVETDRRFVQQPHRRRRQQ